LNEHFELPSSHAESPERARNDWQRLATTEHFNNAWYLTQLIGG
jgi:hypothetical protein